MGIGKFLGSRKPNLAIIWSKNCPMAKNLARVAKIWPPKKIFGPKKFFFRNFFFGQKSKFWGQKKFLTPKFALGWPKNIDFLAKLAILGVKMALEPINLVQTLFFDLKCEYFSMYDILRKKWPPVDFFWRKL